MNLKLGLTLLRRRTMLLIVVVALSAAMLPTAAFASGYGNQGRAYDPGPRQSRTYHRPAKQQRPKYNHQNNYKVDQHKDYKQSRCDVTYKVKRGDSLSKIAQRYHVSVHQLAKENGIKNVNRIFTGQVLCICR